MSSLSPEFEPPSIGRTTDPERDRMVDLGPLDGLPRLEKRHARLAMRLVRAGKALRPVFDELATMLGEAPRSDRPEVLWRPSGLKRAGAIAQLSWPRLAKRVGLGIEPAIAHAIVDRLLGFERSEPEHRLQVTPVEWGVLGFVVVRLLDRLAERPGALGPWDLVIDRVGPEPFPIEGLGAVITLSWPIRVGPAAGSVRLWVPEALIALALVDEPPLPPLPDDPAPWSDRFGAFTSIWKAEAGTITLPRGVARLRPGVVLPIDGSALGGTVSSPEGPIALTQSGPSVRWSIAAESMPKTSGARLRLTSPLVRHPIPDEAAPMPPPPDSQTPSSPPPPASSASPAEVPVTLVVELGRVSLPLARLADLKPGDVVELSRHAREPVELTSGGKLIARGELVQIENELGVRVTNVFL